MRDDKMEMTVSAHPKHVIRFLNLQAVACMIATVSLAGNAFMMYAIFQIDERHPMIAALLAVVILGIACVPMWIMNYRSVQAKIYAGTRNCKFTPGEHPEWEKE